MAGRIIVEATKIRAVELLADGVSASEAALAVGVNAATITRWRHEGDFVAQLDRHRSERWATQQAKMRGLVGKAIDVIAAWLESESDRARIDYAQQVLRSCGLFKVQAPADAETPWERFLEAIAGN